MLKLQMFINPLTKEISMSTTPIAKESTIEFSTSNVKTRIHGETDRCFEEGKKFLEQSSHLLFISFLPTVLTSFSSVLKSVGVPASMCEALAALGTKVGSDTCSPIVKQGVDKSCEVSKRSLHKCTDASVDTSYSLYQRMITWWSGKA